MRRRKIGQLGFADAAIPPAKRRDVLGEINALVDWAPLAALVGQLHQARNGEPAYPPLAMLKVLLLQRWYSLSDPQMEEALADRLSFRRFAGFALADQTPDHSTIWRFREALGRAGLEGALFEALNRQLEARDMLVRKGTLIDATLVTSAARRPRKDEGQTSASDPEARFGRSHEGGPFTFGYKLHVAVDLESDLVRALALTPGHRQEVDLGAELIGRAEGMVYADRGYDAARLHDLVAARGLEDGIMRRGHKGRPLDAAGQARNHRLSAVRRQVERLFGTLKRSYRLARMRVFGQRRVGVDLHLFALAFNLRRWHRLAMG